MSRGRLTGTSSEPKSLYFLIAFSVTEYIQKEGYILTLRNVTIFGEKERVDKISGAFPMFSVDLSP